MMTLQRPAKRSFPTFRPRHRRRLYLLGQVFLALWFSARAIAILMRHETKLPFSSTVLNPATSPGWFYAVVAFWILVGGIALFVAVTELIKIVRSSRRLARRQRKRLAAPVHG